MASEAPSAVDVRDIQFKLNSKFYLIKQEVNENKGNLLAAASSYGLVIIGSSEPNLKVVQLSHIVNDKDKDVIPSRLIPLPVPAHAIALSCDHSMLAVNFKQNELAFVTIFSVPSFLSSNIKILHQSIRLCTDDNVTASQLLWNPVLPNTLAVCLSNKSLLVFAFKEKGYDFYSIDKSEQVGCASWRPKGKQIVVGFPNGKIAQYKPDLKLASTIPCTVRLYNTGWNVIAVQWLSTYQFAAVMLPNEENACPALYIVYAPKNGSPTYTNYYDVCYSQSGPRLAQVILTHILPWNLLLVTSANSTKIGVLGTTDTGDNPLWKQYTMLDEARAELPLTKDKEEMFPLGIDVDTGTTHRIVVDEKQLSPMPMLHMVSTYGLFISFNILNTTPNCPSICSPPLLAPDSSGISSFDIHFGFPVMATIPDKPSFDYCWIWLKINNIAMSQKTYNALYKDCIRLIREKKDQKELTLAKLAVLIDEGKGMGGQYNDSEMPKKIKSLEYTLYLSRRVVTVIKQAKIEVEIEETKANEELIKELAVSNMTDSYRILKANPHLIQAKYLDCLKKYCVTLLDGDLMHKAASQYICLNELLSSSNPNIEENIQTFYEQYFTGNLNLESMERSAKRDLEVTKFMEQMKVDFGPEETYCGWLWSRYKLFINRPYIGQDKKKNW